MKAEIKENMEKIFEEVMGMKAEECRETSLDGSGITSLKFIKFTVVVEDYFDVEVENEYLDLKQYKTVGEMLDTLCKIADK